MESGNVVEGPAATQELALRDGWRARLTADTLEFIKTSAGESRLLSRAQALAQLDRVGLRFPQPFLVLRKPNRRVIKMTADDARVIDRWLGDDFGPEVDHQLRNRMSSAIPFGIFYFLSDRYDWTTWTFGGLLLAEGILFRFRPSYWLLLLDLLFWIALIARNAISFAAHPGVLNTVFGLLSLVLFSVSLRTFRLLRAAHRARSRPASDASPATGGSPPAAAV